MLNQQQYEKLVNGEYMTQVDNSGEQAALQGVQLALLIVEGLWPAEIVRQKALEYLSTFGSILDLPISSETLRTLQVMNYGEEEVQAMEKLDKE